MTEQFDAIVIGAGQAGPPLAAKLAGTGQKVALIERHLLGGTCVNDGCTPTKALVATARVAHQARRSDDFGIGTGPVTVDMPKVMARKNELTAASRKSLNKWLTGTDGLELIFGDASFTDPHTIAVNGRALKADRIFINTGARAAIPDFPGLDETPYLTNTSILELDAVPEHLLIAGGSYIGLEFAQMFHRFGAKVTVIEKGSHIAGKEDPEISDLVREILEDEGITIITGAKDFSCAPDGDGVAVSVSVDGEPKQLSGSHLLLALGRKPNVDALNLDAAGVALDERGYIGVDDHLVTNVPHIFALGDVNGKGAFTHTSYNDFEIVSANLLDGDDRKVSDRIMTYALYTDPPLGRAGMTETQVKKAGIKAVKATMQMTGVGRARERAETRGMMKVLAEADTHRILGVALLGIEADEAVHILLDAMAAGLPYDQIQRTMHIHPTVSELIPTLLADFKPLD
ncbi:FAD-containing oxidoreductase [Devosia sp.]|uniref:FAD-containing oxidoreductase n=1 Tax=Devosia sp. TaxID=1871048 RepID=UPI003A951E22